MEEVGKRMEVLEKELEKIKETLGIENKRKVILDLQLKMAEHGFWQEPKESSRVVEELKSLKGDVDLWDELSGRLKELKEFSSLKDDTFKADILKELNRLSGDTEKFKVRVLFSEKFDLSNAIIEINAGAGGTEACDWAQMLFRMYFRWAEGKKFKLKVLSDLKGDEAGIKNVTFLLEGRRAYGLLKSERGVHRLVRISPFDANKRRHTSFASVDVIPEVANGKNVDLKPEELKIETFRASGRGGQHVNVTDSAVRITHIPSGIVVACQNERSQYQNKQTALRVLGAKLNRLKEKERQEELGKISGKKQRIEWGSQIRSYVLYPYLLVKDHRTNLEVNDARAVLNGGIDSFIYAYLNTQIKQT